MSLDLEKIKKRLEELNNSGSGKSGNVFLKLPEGETTIRILPVNDEDPFKDFFFHYNIGKTPGFLCPQKNFQEKCHVCDFASELWKKGDPDSIAMAKKYFVKQRFYSPVLVRGEEDQGVKIWGYSKTIYEDLLKLAMNPDYGDITDIKSGTDIILSKKITGRQFPEITFQPRRKSSHLCGDMSEEQCKKILESIPDFSTLFDKKSTEDVKEILDEALLGGEDDANVKEDIEKYGNKEISKVDQALNELIEE